MIFQVGDLVYLCRCYAVANNLVWGVVIEVGIGYYRILFLYDDVPAINNHKGEILYYIKSSVDLLENLK
jgi:hypothetical protein